MVTGDRLPGVSLARHLRALLGSQHTAVSVANTLRYVAHAATVLVPLLSVLLGDAALAQSRTTVVDVRKPTVWAQLSSGTADIVGYYDTPQAAWRAYEKYYNGESGGRFFRAFNFRACADSENQYGYYWGTPASWCHDYEVSRNGQIEQAGFTSVISGFEGCQAGTEMANAAPLSGRGGGGEPYIFERRCERAIPVSDPRSCSKVGNPIDAENGAKQQTDIDYLDPGGLLTFARTYNSRHGGFTHNFMADFLPPKKGATGSCALLTEARPPYTTVCAERVNADGTTASFLTAEQHAYRFSWDGTTAAPILSYNKDRLVGSASSGWTLSRTKENQLLTFNASGQLQAVTTVTGRRALLIYSGEGVSGVTPAAGYLTAVTDHFGRRLQFHYGDMGHLERLIDPTGLAIQYVHQDAIRGMSAALNNASARVAHPSQVTFQDGRSVSYAWSEPEHILGGAAPHTNLLTGVVDANGDRFASFGYDTNGRAISTEHAGSANRYSIADGRNSAGAGPITVTDPLGSSRTWQFALAAGLPRITGQAQPGGSGCAAASSALTYDANGNVASRTDFDGRKTCFAHDLTRNLETVRIEGLTQSDACPPDLSVYALSSGMQTKTTIQWHPDWSLEVKKTEPRKATTSIYNGQPDPFNSNALAGCAPPGAKLPDGKPIVVLCKRVEQATTDANGMGGAFGTGSDTSGVVLLLHMDGSDGGASFLDNSAMSRVVTRGGSAVTSASQARFGGTSGRFLGASSDTLRLAGSTETQLPGDFTIEAFVYWSTLPSSHAGIFFGGHELYRSGSTGKLSWWDGSVTRIAGTTTISAGNWHHVALVRRAGVITAYLDGNPEGSYTSTATLGAVGANAESIGSWNGTSEFMNGFIDELRITKGIARYTAAFTPPNAAFAGIPTPGVSGPGQSPLDPNVPDRIWTNTYNQFGQVLTARDPLNKLTTYAYYSDTTDQHTMGDLQSVTDSAGRITQHTRYDKSGRLMQSIDANGTVTDTTYTPRGWVKTVTVTAPGAAAQASLYDYDGVGQLKKATLPDGSALEYTHDAAHRLSSVKDTAGNSVIYTLDNMGNRTGEDLKDPSGALARNITRVYDALNRVQGAAGITQ